MQGGGGLSPHLPLSANAYVPHRLALTLTLTLTLTLALTPTLPLPLPLLLTLTLTLILTLNPHSAEMQHRLDTLGPGGIGHAAIGPGAIGPMGLASPLMAPHDMMAHDERSLRGGRLAKGPAKAPKGSRKRDRPSAMGNMMAV